MIPAWNPAGGKRKQPEGSRAIRLHQRKCCSGCFPFYMSETNPIRTRILTASKDIDCNECQVVCAALANHLAPTELNFEADLDKLRSWASKFQLFSGQQVWCWKTPTSLWTKYLSKMICWSEGNWRYLVWTLQIPGCNGFQILEWSLHEGQGECWKVHGCPPQIAVQWDPDPGAFDDCWYAGEHGISGVSMPNSNL